MRELMIVSGLSGSGKSTFSRVMEEQGFRVVESIPASIVPTYIDYFAEGEEKKEILMISLSDVQEVMNAARKSNKIKAELILLYCSKKELLTRFAVTRHAHPLEKDGLSLDLAIDEETAIFKTVRQRADQVIDTTGLATSELRRILFLLIGQNTGKLRVLIASFGYKYGLPDDADLVFDTRIVPNPYWEGSLTDKCGKDPEVVAWLDAQPSATLVLNNIINYLDFYLPEAAQDHRTTLSIYIGCTGGHHRSVYFADKLFEEYKDQYECVVVHRELKTPIEEGKK